MKWKVMLQLKNHIILLKSLGKGSYGEVFLSVKKGRNEYFATKKMDRKKTDQPNIKKYFDNEVRLLRSLRHPNIVRLEDLKMNRKVNIANQYNNMIQGNINSGNVFTNENVENLNGGLKVVNFNSPI